MSRIGLFGGTFNPVHLAHVKVAGDVKSGFDLDKIIIIPSLLPPHKETGNIADANDRFEMTRLAFSDNKNFTVSDIEIRREGPSYTIDTVNHFKKEFSADDELYFILGIDAFLEIDTWKSFKNLFSIISFIVMSRPGKWDSLETFITDKISSGYTYSAENKRFMHTDKKPIFDYTVTPYDISATSIRRLVKQGKPVQKLVPEKVARHIIAKGLYR